MPETHIRIAEPGDFARLVDLNAEVQQHTSAMDIARLAELDVLASFHKVILVDGRLAGFILAMRENCAYLNDNYAFFAARYETFVYIDRIVIAPDFAGLKLGSMLYRDLFDYARMNAITAVTCEYNIEPPNEPSRRFHDKFGFKQVGSQWLDGGKKNVSLQMATP
jgi:uncharacterized protein